MTTSFSLRDMTPADSPALAALTEQSPDGGAITFRPRFHLPAHEVYEARRGDVIGVVAEQAGTAGLVGAAHASTGECQFEGRVRPYALLSGLMVHPDHRRQGIAAALAEWRIARVDERNGAGTLILADIQTGNVGSIANAKKWATQTGGKIVTSPVTMRSRPPTAQPNITVREATTNELAEIATRQNAFYAEYNFYRPQTVESLQALLRESPFTTPINHYVVAVDAAGRLLAGMVLKEEWRLMSMQIEKVPPVIRFANIFLKVVPPDGEMRSLQCETLWFAEGQIEAARYLWQRVRWDWRDRGSGLLYNYDPRSPVAQVLQTPPWMPTTSTSLAIRSETPMSESRLICPLI